MSTSTRPVSIPHLVFGLIFSGGALVWLIGEATNADLPHSAIGFPAVLIGAGVAGLVATLANSRNRRRALAEGSEPEPASEIDEPDGPDGPDDTEPTTVIQENR